MEFVNKHANNQLEQFARNVFRTMRVSKNMPVHIVKISIIATHNLYFAALSFIASVLPEYLMTLLTCILFLNGFYNIKLNIIYLIIVTCRNKLMLHTHIIKDSN